MDAYQRQAFEQKIDQLRTVVSRTPMWQPDTRDGQPVVVDTHLNKPLLEIVGEWTPDLQRFFEVFNQYSLLKFVALLERMPGTHHEKAAQELMASLRLLDSAQPHRT